MRKRSRSFAFAGAIWKLPFPARRQAPVALCNCGHTGLSPPRPEAFPNAPADILRAAKSGVDSLLGYFRPFRSRIIDYATKMLDAGVTLPGIMKLLGRHSPEMAMDDINVTQPDLRRELELARSHPGVLDLGVFRLSKLQLSGSRMRRQT